VLAAILAGCGSESPAGPATDDPGVTTAVAVTCTAPDSTGQQCRASAQSSNGTAQDITTSAAWTSSNSSVATVDPTGRVTHVGSGQAEIRATSQDRFGGAIILVNLTVTLVSVTCTPESGAHVCTALAQLSNGVVQDVTRSGAAWSSSNPNVATVDSTGRAKSALRLRGSRARSCSTSSFRSARQWSSTSSHCGRGRTATFRITSNYATTGPGPVDISGWQLREWRTDGSIGTRFTVGAGIVLMPGCHYLAAVSPTVAGVARDTQMSFLDPNGGIALIRADGSIVDQAGMNSNSPFREGATLASAVGDENFA
jgi:hypothetical protein